jgi:sigma-E factor negative regulatory protein RseA
MKERLSQLLDGELGDFERRRALRDLESNGELRGAWERYHLIRAALRKEISPAGRCKIADRVAASLRGESNEAGMFVPAGVRRAAQVIGGLAVAAAVATIAILNWGPVSPTAPEPPNVASVAPVAGPGAERAVLAANEAKAKASKDLRQAHADISPYLVQHSEAAAATGVWRPYVRVVSYPAEQ